MRPLSLLLIALLLALATPPAARAKSDDGSILAVNVGGDVVKSGLSLTRIGVAEVGDQYAVGGTFIATKGKFPSQITVKVLTESGRRITRTGRLQRTVIGGLAFVVFLPRQEGAIKLINISR